MQKAEKGLGILKESGQCIYHGGIEIQHNTTAEQIFLHGEKNLLVI